MGLEKRICVFLILKSTKPKMESDDDLLELAGVSSGEEDAYEPTPAAGKKSGLKRRLDDSDDENEDDEDDDDEGEGEEEDDEEGDPYPLESKYKDEQDKAALMAMDEMKREEILYERLQERQKFRERKYLALRAKQSKVEKRALTRGAGSKSLRTSRLSELKKQRQKKSKRNAGDNYSEDEEEEFDDDDDKDLEELAGYGDSEDEYMSSRSRSRNEYDESSYKIASYEEVLKIRSTRDNLLKFLYRDEFDEVMPGTLVRLSVGRQGNKHMYRIARIESVKRGGKIYQFYNKPCNTYLELSQAQSTHTIEMSFISDSPFTNEEFKIYESKLAEYQMKLPTVREVKDKLDELRSMANRKLTDEDINRIVKRKEKLSINSADSASRVRNVTKFREELQVALERGDTIEVDRLRAELDKLTKISQKNSDNSVSKLAEINIRNQRSNQEYIRRAEQKNAELRRKQLMNNDFSDPFSRLRTNPKLFYSSQAKIDAQESSEVAENSGIDKIKFQRSIFRNEGIDAVIKTMALNLDIDI